jgi:hypothetical protein
MHVSALCRSFGQTHLPAANAKQEAHDIALLLLLELLEILVGTHLRPQLANGVFALHLCRGELRGRACAWVKRGLSSIPARSSCKRPSSWIVRTLTFRWAVVVGVLAQRPCLEKRSNGDLKWWLHSWRGWIFKRKVCRACTRVPTFCVKIRCCSMRTCITSLPLLNS